jgi:hypothetical protein
VGVAFQFIDPKTGIKYNGPDASARWAAYLTGQPFAEKGLPPGSAPLGPPPVGTYDPAIDYNAAGANRGYEQTRDDAATAYEQGQQDYGIGLGDLTRGRDRSLADLLTGEGRLKEDYGTQSQDRIRQFDILGRQQGERAAQQGVTSQGLLRKSEVVRDQNAKLVQSGIDTAYNRGVQDIGTSRTRVGEDFDRGKLGLDLGNARTFGGYGGNVINNPLTGAPAFGSLLTSLTRAGGENNAFQTYSAGQRSSQAAAGGYVAPGVIPPEPGTRSVAANDFIRRLKGRIT